MLTETVGSTCLAAQNSAEPWRADLSSDRLDTENTAEFSFPVLLLSEGKSDASFLMHLCEVRQLAHVHFGFPTPDMGGHGQSAFGKYLGRITTRAGFDLLKAILILY